MESDNLQIILKELKDIKAKQSSPYLSISEACAYLKIGKTTLYELEKKGMLKKLVLQGTKRSLYNKNDLDKLVIPVE